ncbi:hypothetical protein D3C87_176790 [compost metagenome]
MKYLLFILTFSFFSAAMASAEYDCGPFKNKDGLEKMDGVTAFIIENEQAEIKLYIGRRMGIVSYFDLVNTNKGPVFNLYTYKAGPYTVLYYQDKNTFVVKKDGFQSVCQEIRK